jgi:glutaredoxin-like protein
MGLFSDKVVEETKQVLGGMTEPVRMTYFTQEAECDHCTATTRFIDEFTALDERLTVERKDFLGDGELARQMGVHHVPALLLHRPADGRPAVRYYGLPGGYEYGAFLKTLVLFSSGRFDQPLEKASLDLIDRDINLKTFVLATCPSCPVMVYLVNGLAYLSSRVTAEIIEANTFVDLATRFTVGAVPKIIINETAEVVGVLPPEELIRRIRAG